MFNNKTRQTSEQFQIRQPVGHGIVSAGVGMPILSEPGAMTPLPSRPSVSVRYHQPARDVGTALRVSRVTLVTPSRDDSLSPWRRPVGHDGPPPAARRSAPGARHSATRGRWTVKASRPRRRPRSSPIPSDLCYRRGSADGTARWVSRRRGSFPHDPESGA